MFVDDCKRRGCLRITQDDIARRLTPSAGPDTVLVDLEPGHPHAGHGQIPDDCRLEPGTVSKLAIVGRISERHPVDHASRHGLPVEVLLHSGHGVGHGDHVADIMVRQENDFMRHAVCSRVSGSG